MVATYQLTTTANDLADGTPVPFGTGIGASELPFAMDRSEQAQLPPCLRAFGQVAYFPTHSDFKSTAQYKLTFKTAIDITVGNRTDRDRAQSRSLFYQPFRQLWEALSLPENWDENDAHPVTNAAFQAASRLLTRIMLNTSSSLIERAVPSTIFPLPTGGLNLQWRNRWGLADVEISPSAAFSMVRQIGFGLEARYEAQGDIPENEVLGHVAEVTRWTR